MRTAFFAFALLLTIGSCTPNGESNAESVNLTDSLQVDVSHSDSTEVDTVR